MYTDEYPDCCGVGCIFTFYPDDYYSDDGPMVLSSKIVSEYIKGRLARREFGMLTLVLADKQIPALHKTIKSFGFKNLPTFKNPNTGNKIRFYYKVVNQPTKRKTKPRFA